MRFKTVWSRLTLVVLLIAVFPAPAASQNSWQKKSTSGAKGIKRISEARRSALLAWKGSGRATLSVGSQRTQNPPASGPAHLGSFTRKAKPSRLISPWVDFLLPTGGWATASHVPARRSNKDKLAPPHGSRSSAWYVDPPAKRGSHLD